MNNNNYIAEHEYYTVLPDVIEKALNDTYELISGGMTWREEEALLRDSFQHKLITANLKGFTGVDIKLTDVLVHYDDLIWLGDYDALDGLDWLNCVKCKKNYHGDVPADVWVLEKQHANYLIRDSFNLFQFMCAKHALEFGGVYGEDRKSLKLMTESTEGTVLFSDRDDYSDLLEDPAQWNLWDEGKTRIQKALPTYIPKDCKHHRQPFVFHEYTGDGSENKRTIYATASSSRTAPMQGQEEPLMQVWLATTHLNHASSDIWTQGITIPDRFAGTDTPMPQPKPAIFINWPDMGVMLVNEIRPVVKYVRMMLNNATKSPIEIGCVGAHGRTGTFMALVLVESGYTADEAIKIVRKDYCKHAIETVKQEEMIKEYERNLIT